MKKLKHWMEIIEVEQGERYANLASRIYCDADFQYLKSLLSTFHGHCWSFCTQTYKMEIGKRECDPTFFCAVSINIRKQCFPFGQQKIHFIGMAEKCQWKMTNHSNLNHKAFYLRRFYDLGSFVNSTFALYLSLYIIVDSTYIHF